MENLCHLRLAEPPEFLYFAMDGDSSHKAFMHGLKRKGEPFVTLYGNEALARKDLRRLPYVTLFAVVARVMSEDGYKFALADSGEWVIDEVPPKYLRLQ